MCSFREFYLRGMCIPCGCCRTLKSKYVTGDVAVSVVDKILIQDVCIVFGNDLAGGHCVMCCVKSA